MDFLFITDAQSYLHMHIMMKTIKLSWQIRPVYFIQTHWRDKRQDKQHITSVQKQYLLRTKHLYTKMWP